MSAPANEIPTLENCLNLQDMEQAAVKLLGSKAYAYYASAGDDEKTKRWNTEAFDLIRFRPRLLRNVKLVDTSINLLGFSSALPFFISPAALAGLAHKDGEICFSRAAKAARIPYIVSANASLSLEEIARESDSQTMFYQLYVNTDRATTEKLLRRVVAAGYKAIVVTVDAPVAGNRERDDRVKINDEIAGDGGFRNAVVKSQSLAEMGFSYVDATLQWTDLDWIRQVTKLPVIVKGVQSYEDALLCVKHRAHIYLSNHGGRQLEGAPSAIETLLEIRKYAPEVLKSSSQILADGGIKRGTDVLKLLALGATSVGVGRPFMYSLAFDNGPERVIEIMSKEIRTNMRLLGATSINEMCEEMVNTRRLDDTIYVAASPKSKL